MRTLNFEAYQVCLEHIGLKEIKGPENNRMIEIAHYLTRMVGHNPKGVDVDSTIPWCSSWVTFCFVVAMMRRNPRQTIDILAQRKVVRSVVQEIMNIAGVNFVRDTGLEVDTKLPWSASSRTWDTWGVEVPWDQARRGDIVRLTRDGGGHVAFLDEDKLGTLSLRIVGGNQSDMVCSSDRYMKSRLVTIRRSTI